MPAEVDAKGDTDRLTPEALKELVNKPELLALTESLTPEQTVAFWMPESEMEALELELGAGVRLKTRGDGPFLGEQCSPRCRLLFPLACGRPHPPQPRSSQIWPLRGQDPLRYIPKSQGSALRPVVWTP